MPCRQNTPRTFSKLAWEAKPCLLWLLCQFSLGDWHLGLADWDVQISSHSGFMGFCGFAYFSSSCSVIAETTKIQADASRVAPDPVSYLRSRARLGVFNFVFNVFFILLGMFTFVSLSIVIHPVTLLGNFFSPDGWTGSRKRSFLNFLVLISYFKGFHDLKLS